MGLHILRKVSLGEGQIVTHEAIDKMSRYKGWEVNQRKSQEIKIYTQSIQKPEDLPGRNSVLSPGL
jgi:hypothetical protein